MHQPLGPPGTWTIFATTCRECPAGCGMHVRCRGGRVVKPEGNPNHPVSRGGLCPRGQSAPQGLYDPDRVRRPLKRKGPHGPHGPKEAGDASARPLGPFEPVSWPQAIDGIKQALDQAKRLFVVSDLQTGALAEVMQQFHRSRGIPGQVVFHEAFAYEALRAANARLFGRPVIPRYRLDQCDFILSFGADFLESWISNVEFAWQFSEMHHRPPDYGGDMVYIGPRLSMTAANADHFFQIPAGQEYRLALAILQEVANPDRGIGPISGLSPESVRHLARRFVQAKNSVALGGPVGATGPAAENLAAAVMLLNQAAGRIGTTVDFSQAHALGSTVPSIQLEELFADLGEGDVLIVHDANPVYHLPHLQERIGRAGHIIFLGTMLNETAALAQWVLPVLSPLEAWGDYEPWASVHCLMQPTMGPLHEAWHSGDVFLALSGGAGEQTLSAHERVAEQGPGRKVETFHDVLMQRWRGLQEKIAPQVSFELFWQKSLQDGVVVEPVERQPAPALQGQPPAMAAASQADEGMHLWLWPSILLFDGRLANRGWMQEIPERMSTLTWGSWVDISPATARQLEIAGGDVIEVSNKFGAVRAPARVTEDVADNVAALAFGQGHTSLGEVADGRGVNAFALLARGEPGSLFGAVSLRKTGEQGPLIFLSATQDQYDRRIIQWIPRQELRTMQDNDIEEIIWPLPKGYDPRRDLYPPHEYPNHRWAMVVDLDRCIGCGACETACYAENNIPVMGPRPLMRGREMSWLKVPPYRHPRNSARVGFLPLPCQHCDAAPCEPVCPVFAAVHNDQGLNAQIYNRCIGTRYCSNNCPYKVRRFEWFNPRWREPLHLQLNPDVTVRSRGVMEKCTFCVQRILYAERRAKAEGRTLRDGEVQPACVQSCPTRTFVFGDLMQPESQVSRLFNHPRRYQLLKELNTKPAVIYLKRIEPEQPETA
jgi:Fe-S-cluster-containing dehydrogenase component